MSPDQVQFLGLLTAALSVIASSAAAWAAYSAPLRAAQMAEGLRRAGVRQELKFDCMRRVAGLRSATPQPGWLAALNEIVVVFNDSEQVLKSLAQFERTIRRGAGHRNEELLDLIKAMMNDLGLKRDHIDDEFLLRPFGSNT